MERKMPFIIFLFIFSCSDVLAYDQVDSHPRISESASRISNLENYLIKNLGLPQGFDTKLPSTGKDSILDYIRKGSTDEDSPMCRATNHFHNPLKPWDQSYLSDDTTPLGLFVRESCGLAGWPYSERKSNVTWGTGYISPVGGKVDCPNQYMGWNDARDYYYWALTGISDTERETYFAKTFQALGQVLHLIQDISVPAHVRNDFTSHYLAYGPTITGVFINQYEKYVKGNSGLIISASPAFPSFGSPRVTDFWDTDQYTGDNPSTSLSLGLAEFTNANYFSDWTIPNNKPEMQHLFPYPMVNSGNAQICEDYAPGSQDLRKYISRRKDDGQCPPITEARMADHFATPSLLNEESLIINENISSLKLWLDENVHDTYARELLPRAIGYSAGLLNYFFRGNLQVMVVPIFYKGNLSFMKLKIKNMTPDEAMKNGNFALIYRYTPKGGPTDGSEDIFGQAWGLDSSAVVPCIELKGASKKADGTMEWGEMEVDFMIYPALPKKDYDSIRFMLAFQGTLGNEVGAVVGKAFSPGEVVFNEEWDNGLTGNHIWGHTGLNLDNGNPDNGSTGNVIVGDTLIKDNIRFKDEGEARVNESTVSMLCCNGQFKDILPILVTPNTYLMYKIDALSINQIPPAPPGGTNQWQGLWLYFNHGLVLQISQEGQMVYWNPTTAYYTFPLGAVVLDNIHKLFQGWGIVIPEGPFYLQSIDFIQQLSVLGILPSSVENHQHMEVGFIQIIEGKEQ